MRDLRADILGGHHSGTWTADFTVAPPTYAGTGNITRVSMAQLATLMHDNWAAGAVDAQYSLAMRGVDARQPSRFGNRLSRLHLE